MREISHMPLPLSPQQLQQQVQQALDEDIGSGDVTAALVYEGTRVSAFILCREDAILCGQAWVDEVFRQLDAGIRIEWYFQDGNSLRAGDRLCTLQGLARPLLTGERTALNFLQTLSGVATTTYRYVQQLEGLDCKLLDTRKTIPGLRLAEKYAVTCGGGFNHRLGLYDAYLIKENHITAAGGILPAIQTAREMNDQVWIEVEVENLAQLQEAIEAGAERILLDNMDIPTLREAVRINQGRTELEASGGIELDNLRDIAASGVDYISTGAITKHLHAIDFSMRFIQQ